MKWVGDERMKKTDEEEEKKMRNGGRARGATKLIKLLTQINFPDERVLACFLMKTEQAIAAAQLQRRFRKASIVQGS